MRIFLFTSMGLLGVSLLFTWIAAGGGHWSEYDKGSTTVAFGLTEFKTEVGGHSTTVDYSDISGNVAEKVEHAGKGVTAFIALASIAGVGLAGIYTLVVLNRLEQFHKLALPLSAATALLLFFPWVIWAGAGHAALTDFKMGTEDIGKDVSLAYCFYLSLFAWLFSLGMVGTTYKMASEDSGEALLSGASESNVHYQAATDTTYA